MPYHKINGIYKRYTKFEEIPEGKKQGDFIEGDFSEPEFGYLFDRVWEWTEKLDGINMRIKVPAVGINGKIFFRGKTNNAQIPGPLNEWMNAFVEKNATKLYQMFPDGAILYGEGVGGKIQKGSHFGDQHYKLFDVFTNCFWLKNEDVADVAIELGLEFAPLVASCTVPEAIELVRGGIVSAFGDFQAEGLVGTPLYGLKFRNGGRIITKLKTVDFK